MKKILLTGAAGFIGFHVALALHKRGDFVIGMDNYNDYYDPILKEARSKVLPIEVVREDICNKEVIISLIKKHNITDVVHLAAQAGVRYSLDHPDVYIHSNIQGFLSILEALRQFPSIKLTYASSSSVYGLNDQTPFSVKDRTDLQASLYGVTKKANELMSQTYHHLFGIRSTGLRFFTVYGPFGRPDMAYFSFVKAIFEGKAIPVFAEGELERDFTYIDDIVEGTLASIDHLGGCSIFNLGNHQPVKVKKFISIIEEAVGKKAKINFLPMQPGDVVKTFADIEESEKELGYYPKTSLEKGIPQFVQWFKEFYGL